ncbi:recombinase family protein [Paenibacillus cisolokensis]|uniref:recombinase family protein n=1 Tax=Paenibacillus cisolokensis TaxID=1658519 RepID=UPI003D2ADD51
MADKKKIIRAVAYPRYSSDNQREESIIAQMRAIEQYCQQKGYVLVDAYPDEEKTATTDRRPNFQRMIEDSAKRLFDVVVVHKLDRFARNRYDSAHYKRILKRNGVRVESVLEQLDGSPEAVILESMLEGMAEYYSLNLAREVRKGMRENAEKGIHTGGRPPYGLRINPETRLLEIDPERNKAVRIYFEGLDKDVPRAQIARTLNELGYRTQEGRKFTVNSFQGWATNRKYRGDYVFDVSAPKDDEGKRNTAKKKPEEVHIIIPGLIPPSVDPELFDRVNAKLSMRKRKAGRMKAKVNYLLTGKIVCGQCGSLFAGNSYRNPKSKDNSLLTYYKCQGKCGNTSVRKEDIEAITIEELIKHCFSREGMTETVKRVQAMYAEQRQTSQNDVEPIKKELRELEGLIENWINALGKGIKGLEEKIVEAQHRQEALEFELSKIQAMQSVSALDESLIIKILEEKKTTLLSADEDDKKAVLQEYVDRVVIQPSKDINRFEAEITYRVFNNGGEGSRTPVRR